MSTGLSCEFIEPRPGEWYYVLQWPSCSVSAWDWREYASCYGPFVDKTAADKHLHYSHPNPGGSEIIANAVFKMDGIYQRLIGEAQK